MVRVSRLRTIPFLEIEWQTWTSRDMRQYVQCRTKSSQTFKITLSFKLKQGFRVKYLSQLTMHECMAWCVGSTWNTNTLFHGWMKWIYILWSMKNVPRPSFFYSAPLLLLLCYAVKILCEIPFLSLSFSKCLTFETCTNQEETLCTLEKKKQGKANQKKTLIFLSFSLFLSVSVSVWLVWVWSLYR